MVNDVSHQSGLEFRWYWPDLTMSYQLCWEITEREVETHGRSRFVRGVPVPSYFEGQMRDM
jgi:hypothetical protein